MSDPVVCARCGRMEPEAPPTWTCQTGDRGREWLCEQCTRAHLRDIEGRLDPEWW